MPDDIELPALPPHEATSGLFKTWGEGAMIAYARQAVAAAVAAERERAAAGLTPAAWIKGFWSAGSPEDPPEWNEECVSGDMPPQDDGTWVALYADPPAPAQPEDARGEDARDAARWRAIEPLLAVQPEDGHTLIVAGDVIGRVSGHWPDAGVAIDAANRAAMQAERGEDER